MNYTFDIVIAANHGVDEAILLQNIAFWVSKNQANEKHFYDGFHWMYNSMQAFTELFPFWNKFQIKRILDSLISQKLIQSGNYNKKGFDRTKWYSLTSKAIESYYPHIVKNLTMDSEKSHHPKCEISPPIPDIKPDSKSDIKNLEDKSSKYIGESKILEESEESNLKPFDKKLNSLQKKLLGKGKNTKKKTLESCVVQFTTNDLVRKALFDYLAMRKEQRHNPTVVSFDLMLDRLKLMSGGSTAKAIEIVENSTIKGYKDFYNPQSLAQVTKFDNMGKAERAKPACSLDDKEKETFYNEELAKDSRGVYLEF